MLFLVGIAVVPAPWAPSRHRPPRHREDRALSILRAETLKCEYRDDVPCVDDPAPRLSWTLASDRRDERQTAYRIVAALGEADVRAGRGTLWDSGRVASGESLGIPYAGRPLPAGAEIVWAVQVWSRDGEVYGWSAPARFRT